MNGTFFRDMLATLTGRRRGSMQRVGILPGAAVRTAEAGSVDAILKCSHALLSGQGEASGAALARQWLGAYARLPQAGRAELFEKLGEVFGPDRARLQSAWEAYSAAGDPATLTALFHAIEPPRQELFRRLNRASGGTGALVAMRQDMLELNQQSPAVRSVEDDLIHLFKSWFNRGFLVMQRISWSSPADILERIIRYEAVHAIDGWDDLRRRLEPPDRRCYAFFHPALIDEPLIFIEVALTADIPGSIQGVLADDRPRIPAEAAKTAVFYSISNCQPGLKGISFGNFLIKQVVEDLSRDLPSLKTFVTLSPVPSFASWLRRALADPAAAGLEGLDPGLLATLAEPGWRGDPAAEERLRPIVTGLAAHYYLRAKDRHGRPVDPVARFHLGNGARLERINWLGDTSPKGMKEAHGLMVNYLYDLKHIEENHEVFANTGRVVASKTVERQLREFHAGLVRATADARTA